MRISIAIVLVALSACERKPDPGRIDPGTAAPVSPPPALRGDGVAAVAAPRGSRHPRVTPPRQVAWTMPKRAASEQERLLAGTWAATVGEYATRSLFMADRTMFTVDAKGKDLVEAVMTALERDDQVKSNCIWLELHADFTGFRRECMLVDGVPSALDQNHVATGAKSDLGTKLDWFIDETDRNAIKIRFHADMVVPAPGPAGLRELVFRHWTLRFDKAAQGQNRFAMIESVPEHDYTLPTKYVYEIHSGAYLDK